MQIIARKCDWFLVLFAPVVIGRNNCFGIGLATVTRKSFYQREAITPAAKYVIDPRHQFTSH